MTSEDREIWGRVSSHFVGLVPPSALQASMLSYIGLAIGLAHMAGAQDQQDYAALSVCQNSGRYLFKAYTMSGDRVDIRGCPLDDDSGSS